VSHKEKRERKKGKKKEKEKKERKKGKKKNERKKNERSTEKETKRKKRTQKGASCSFLCTDLFFSLAATRSERVTIQTNEVR
jgi:hypothetical protein